MSRTPNVDFVFPYLLLNLLWQYFHGGQGEILSRSHCSAHPLFSSVVQLASRVTGISHNSVRLFIYLRALCHSGVTPMESHLWVEVLARRRAVPCVIPALWRGGHIPATVLLAEQSPLLLRRGALLGSRMSFCLLSF